MKTFTQLKEEYLEKINKFIANSKNQSFSDYKPGIGPKNFSLKHSSYGTPTFISKNHMTFHNHMVVYFEHFQNYKHTQYSSVEKKPISFFDEDLLIFTFQSMLSFWEEIRILRDFEGIIFLYNDKLLNEEFVQFMKSEVGIINESNERIEILSLLEFPLLKISITENLRNAVDSFGYFLEKIDETIKEVPILTKHTEAIKRLLFKRTDKINVVGEDLVLIHEDSNLIIENSDNQKFVLKKSEEMINFFSELVSSKQIENIITGDKETYYELLDLIGVKLKYGSLGVLLDEDEQINNLINAPYVVLEDFLLNWNNIESALSKMIGLLKVDDNFKKYVVDNVNMNQKERLRIAHFKLENSHYFFVAVHKYTFSSDGHYAGNLLDFKIIIDKTDENKEISNIVISHMMRN